MNFSDNSIMKNFACILFIFFFHLKMFGQEKIPIYPYDSTTLKLVDLIETKTWCYKQHDTSFLFITNQEEFNRFECKTRNKIDFNKYNYLQIYINATGCQLPDIDIFVQRNLQTNESLLKINIIQYGRCLRSDHYFYSYLVNKKDCPAIPEIVKSVIIR